MQQPSLAQYLINWLEQDLTQQYGTQWENIPDDESQYLYIPNKENPRTVIRLADHLCSLYEFTKHIKEEQNVLFKSIVFKEINYAGNTNGLWDAEGQEIVFENVDEVYEHYYDVLPKIENDIIKVINEGGDYTDSTGMADVHPIKVTNIVRKDGKVKLSWDGTGEDPLIKYKKEHNIKESKTNKNIKKNVVMINENALRQIVAESVKKVLKEYHPDKVWRDTQAELFHKKQIEQDEMEISACMSEIKPIFDRLEDKYGDLAYTAIMRLAAEMNPNPEY